MNLKFKANGELSKVEVLKLLMERSHAEAQLFWQRNNFMFLVSTALLGAAFNCFFLNIPDPKPANEIKTAFSISGIFLSFVWLAFNKVGRRMNHVYMQDAKNIAKNDELLRKIFENTLGDKTPSESVKKKEQPLCRKIEKYHSATMINYIFIFGFVAAWLFVLFKPIP